MISITGKAVLVTGANRGIGQALVDEALSRGARQVYAGARAPGPPRPARHAADGVEHEEEDIFPDPLSQSMAESWRSGAAKTLERENAALAR